MSLIFLTPLAALLLGMVLGTALWFRGWRKAGAVALVFVMLLLALAGVARAVGPTCPKCPVTTDSPIENPCEMCCQIYSTWYCWITFLFLCDCEGGEGQ
jgi:hypothetical protein